MSARPQSSPRRPASTGRGRAKPALADAVPVPAPRAAATPAAAKTPRRTGAREAQATATSAAASAAAPTPATPPAPPAPAAPFAALLPGGEALAESATHMLGGFMATLQAAAGLSLPPAALAQVHDDYTREATALWNRMLSGEGVPPSTDRRFAAAAWTQNPLAGFTAAQYLLNAKALTRLAEAVQGDDKSRARIRFAVQQWIDAAAPSNFLALNPEALQKAVDTRGESVSHGMALLLEDLRRGHVSQTDERVFEVGRNVAVTPGAVVFENELFQLIEYAPLTPKVHERPTLFVPPCINKYYIMDLQPENSLIRYTVEQGHRLFVVSWRNPDASLAATTWDDYIEDGAIRAIEVVQDIAGAPQINTLGFCVGGTILSTALAVLAARGQRPAASLTLLTSFLDFSRTGVIDVFVDEAAVDLREMTIGAHAPQGPGLLRGSELATTFSFLRPNELVWNYVVGNYLKGEMPPPFDLLYWNSDSTNLPGPMFCWYLRHTYLEDKLKVPGALTVCGERLDLTALDMPAYVYASREDHIVPWDSAYLNTRILSGDVRFMLGASGHIAGVINPPHKHKRSHWVREAAGPLPGTAEAWLASATERPGSWWPDWARWLAGHAGKLKPAPTVPGSPRHPVIEAAPGRYVKQKA